MKLQMLKRALIAYVANSAKAIWSAVAHPLTIIGKKNCNVADYRIYGNSVQNGEPTPDNPVEVQSVGEYQTEGEYAGKYKIPVTARGKNLFDKNNVKNGFYASQKGESANTQMCCTNYFIPIKPNTEYTWTSFRGSHGFGTVFYDESKSSVSRQFISTLSFTTPDNAHYMKLNIYISEKETFQLVKGASLGNYEPYIEPQTVNIYLDEPLKTGQVIQMSKDNLPSLPQFKGTTVYEAQTEIPPSGMQVQYY